MNCTGSQYGAVVGICGQWWTCCKNIINHSYKTQCSFRVFTKCTHTCNVCYNTQIQYAQLTAVTYQHADAGISYIEATTDCQFFQMYASVNTNTMIN